MGWPLGYALTLFRESETKLVRRLLVVSGPLFLSCCYFSMSRGPWLAAVVVGITLVLFGTKLIRKNLGIIMVLVVVVLVARPGVLNTFTGKAEQTVDTDSQKGGTARYRMELWVIAWDQVKESPLKMLFGYGLGAGREIQLDWNLSYRGKSYVIDSWDNHFAYALYQSGLLGLAAVMSLHCGAGLVLLKMWRRTTDPERTILACCMGSVVAMVFMMTNVLIFAKQLNFAFWSVFAAGVAIAGYYGPNRLHEEEVETQELVDGEIDPEHQVVEVVGVNAGAEESAGTQKRTEL
jgi:O-antigen ligase